MIDTFFTRLSRGIELLLGVALLFAVGLNFANVVQRYGFDSGILWADEVQIYIMIWMAFLGAVVCTWRNIHLRMDVLLNRSPPLVQRVLQFAEALALTALAGVVAYQSAQYAQLMHSIGKLTDVAQIPAWIPHLAIGIGFGLILVIALVRLVRLFKPAPKAGAL